MTFNFQLFALLFLIFFQVSMAQGAPLIWPVAGLNYKHGEAFFYAGQSQAEGRRVLKLYCQPQNDRAVNAAIYDVYNLATGDGPSPALMFTKALTVSAQHQTCVQFLNYSKKNPTAAAPFLMSNRTSKTLPMPYETEKFDRDDFAAIEKINEYFTKGPVVESTYTLTHGRKTKKVIVFLHGLMMGSNYWDSAITYGSYFAGHNVIVATLPGHENPNMETQKGAAGTWLIYAEYVARLAKNYGEEIVFVGHSLGGQLSIRMAEIGLADRLILVNPLVGVDEFNEALLDFGQKFPGLVGKVMSNYQPPKKASRMTLEAVKLSKQSLRTLPEKTSVVVLLAEKDGVVSVDKTRRWFNSLKNKKQIYKMKNRFEGDSLGIEAHMDLNFPPKSFVELMN